MTATTEDDVAADPPSEEQGADAPPGRHSGDGHPSRRELGAREFAVATLLLAVAMVLVAITVQRAGSQFYADDYLYLQLARQGSLTWSWLTIDNYGHFAPLTRLAYLGVQRWWGLDYAAASVLPALLVATIFLSLVWMFRELVGRRPIVLGLALLGATSAPLIRVVLWWGAAVHVLGAAAMMTLCVAAFVAHGRSGREVYRAVSVAALAVGLLVQERPMLTIGYLVLIRYLFAIGLPHARGLRARIRPEALFWMPWVVVEVAYFVYRVFFFSSSPQPGSASEAVDFVGQSVLRGWAPSLVGSRLQPYAPLVNLTTVLGLIAFAAVTAVLFWRRRGAWRTLFFLVSIYLANLGIVAVGRLSVVNVSAVAADLQYYVDVHIGTVMAFTLGFATLPRRYPGRGRVSPIRVVALVAALALAISTAVTWRATIRVNPQRGAHDFINRAQADLHARHDSYALMRTKMPIYVAPSFLDPFTDVTAVFSLDHQVADRLDPTSQDRIALTGDGEVVAVHPSTLASVDGITHQDVTSGLGTLRYGPQGVCVSGPAGSYAQIQLPRTVVGNGLFYGVTYTSSKDQTVNLSARATHVHYNWSATDLPAGRSAVVVDRIDATKVQDMALVFEQPVTDACITSVWVGRLAAVVDGSCVTLDDYALPIDASTDCDASWP